jgi:hypothetical protein
MSGDNEISQVGSENVSFPPPPNDPPRFLLRRMNPPDSRTLQSSTALISQDNEILISQDLKTTRS